MVSQAHGEAVRDDILFGYFGDEIVGNSVENREGVMTLLFYLRSDVPPGTFPDEKDGVKITTMVVGEVEAQQE